MTIYVNVADVRPGDRTGDKPGNLEFLDGPSHKRYTDGAAVVGWRVRVVGDGALEDRYWLPDTFFVVERGDS